MIEERKIELSRRVSSSIANDIWEMSQLVWDANEFVDYLMTITDEEAIEEFFNRCHDENGRFCEGGPLSAVKSGIDRVRYGPKKGPFTDTYEDSVKRGVKDPVPPQDADIRQINRNLLRYERGLKRQEKRTGSVHGQATLGYKGRGIKLNTAERKQLQSEIKTHRAESPVFRDVVGPMGHLRSKKLAKIDLKEFTTPQLRTIETQAKAIRYTSDMARRWSISPIQRIIWRGISDRVYAQGTRVGRELRKRGSKPQYSSWDLLRQQRGFASLGQQFAKISDEERADLPEIIRALEEYVNDTDPGSELNNKQKAAVQAQIEHLKSLE